MKKTIILNKATDSPEKYYYILLFAVLVAACQYFFFSFVFDGQSARLFYSFVLFCAAALMLLFYYNGIEPYYLAPLLCVFVAWNISFTHIQSITVFVYYGLFAILLTGAKMFESRVNHVQGGIIFEKKYTPSYGLFVILAGLSVLFISFDWFMRGFFFNIFPRSLELLWFFPSRELGICGNDLCAAPFRKLFLLLIPLAYITAALVFFGYIRKSKDKSVPAALMGILAFAVLGKFAVMAISTYGVDILAVKTSAPVDTAYYHFAVMIKNSSEFIKNYVALYQSGGLGAVQTSHLKGHPVMATLFYKILIKIFSPNPFLVGSAYTVISACVIFPIYFIVKELTGDAKTGVYASFLYILTPFNLILSSAGIDSIVLFLLAVSIAVFMIPDVRGRILYSVIAGIVFGLDTYLTFGLWPLLAVFPMLYMAKNGNAGGKIEYMFKHLIFFAVGILLFHLLFQVITLFKYDYIASFKAARAAVNDVSNRPYILWWWANIIHWSIYMSVSVSAMFVYRLFQSAKGGIKMDWYSIAAVAAMAVYFLSCMGRAEQHRQWMFLAVFVLPAAMISLGEKDNKGRFSVNINYFVILSLLSFINSVLLEIFITDVV